MSKKRKVAVVLVGIAVFAFAIWFHANEKGKLQNALSKISNPVSSLSPPAMPENKSEAMVKSESEFKSPVLEKTQERRFNTLRMVELNGALWREGIKVTIGYADDAVLIYFLYALLNDEESQKVFRQFSKAGVLIYLTDEYKIGDEFVYVDITKGVKKVAEWLKTGKI